jgi:large subunit ribosomal protein L4
MELNLQTMSAELRGVISVSDKIFATPFNETLVHQIVTTYLARGRAGTRALKSRAQVRGSGNKPWRQKGTGRARAGSVKSPLWRGGGITFAVGQIERSQKKWNRKMYRVALRSILSELIRQARFLVIEQFVVEKPKTRELVAQLKVLNLGKVLIVTEKKDENLRLAARNLHTVEVMELDVLNPVSLIGFEKVLMTVKALRKLEESLV